MSIRTGGSVSSVPATAIFGHLVIFIVAHFRRWRLYKVVVNSYNRFLFERYFRMILKLVLQVFKTALLCGTVCYAVKKSVVRPLCVTIKLKPECYVSVT